MVERGPRGPRELLMPPLPVAIIAEVRSARLAQGGRLGLVIGTASCLSGLLFALL